MDVPIDGLPAFDLVDVAPSEILEGQGDGGSTPALVVIHVHNLVADHVSVALANNTVSTMLSIDTAVVSTDHEYIAVPVTAHVDTSLTTTVALDLTVTEGSGSGAVSTTLANAISLRGLPELTSLVQTASPISGDPPYADTAQLQPLYSRIDLTALSIPLGGTSPAVFRSVSDLRVESLHADASETTGSTVGLPGPGGCSGGAPGAAGGCAGGGQPGTGTGGGGGAGFAVAGGTATGAGAGGPVVGDPAIASYASNRAAGGGGGSTGGAGGGGGGVIELTAGGDVLANMLTVNGSNGGSTSSNMAGGGGAGGVVVLRGGHYAGAAQISASGGGGLVNVAGAGSPGRVRWDGPMGQAPSNAGSIHRGLSFVPAIRNYPTAQPAIAIVGEPSDTFTATVIDATGTIHPDTGATLDGTGQATIHPMLSPGLNRICVTLPGAQYGTFEADTCVSAAYLP